MNFFKKAYCRMLQGVFRLAVPFMPIKAPKLLSDCAEIGTLFANKGVKRALIVTGPNVRKHGLTDPVLTALEANGIGYEIYDRTPANPTIYAIEEAFALYRERACDALIAVGGGSPIDCAKGVCARILKPKKSLLQMKGMLKVRGKQPPFVAVPTTSGTGSEATVATVVTDEKTHHKFTVLSFCLLPKYALLDPVMTRTLPPAPTAETGLDALTHAVEAYIGRATTACTRRLAESAVRRIRESLLSAYENGDDLAARKNMQLAAYEAGLAITKSYVGYVHAVAHSLGGHVQLSARKDERKAFAHRFGHVWLLLPQKACKTCPQERRKYGKGSSNRRAGIHRFRAHVESQNGYARNACNRRKGYSPDGARCR